MNKNSFSGKFIVIEGIDGSGKFIQTKLLTERLKKEGHKVAKIDFPQYGQKSAGLIEEYLTGKYGEIKDIGPYCASVFYACDRYDASFKIRKWLEEGRIVVSDRYIGSNIGHQGGKIKNKAERKKFIKWLYGLEYGIFEIPKPDATFILKTSPEISLRLTKREIPEKEKRAKKMIYLKKDKKDIHENIPHLKAALNSYLMAAREFPRDFKVIECLENGKFLSPEIIHQKIWAMAKKEIKKQ